MECCSIFVVLKNKSENKNFRTKVTTMKALKALDQIKLRLEEFRRDSIPL